MSDQVLTKTSHLVSEDMPIMELIDRHPEALPVLMEYGFHCIGCAVSDVETIGSGSAIHGFEVEDVLTDIDLAIQDAQEDA